MCGPSWRRAVRPVRAALYRRRRPPARGGGRGARRHVRPATRAVMRREFEVFGQRRFERSGAAVERPLVQLAPVSHLSTQTHHVHQDPADTGRHWRAPQAPARRAARLPTRRHRSPGRPRWRQGGVSHQHGRRGHTVRAHRLRPGHLRTLSPPRARSEPPGVSLSNPGIPHRQWLRVHQPTGRGAEQAAYRRVHQVPRRNSNDNALVEGKNGSVSANTSDTTTSPSASPPGSTPSPMTCYRRSEPPSTLPVPHRTPRPQRENPQTLPRPGHRPRPMRSSNPCPMPRSSSNPGHLPMPSPDTRPRRRPRSQCRPRLFRSVRAATRRRVTPPSHARAASQQPPPCGPIAAHHAPFPLASSTPLTCIPPRWLQDPNPILCVQAHLWRFPGRAGPGLFTLIDIRLRGLETEGATHASPLHGSSDAPDQHHFAQISLFGPSISVWRLSVK